MKALVVVSVPVAAGTLGFYLISRDQGSHESHESQPPTATLTDATKVFQKSLWKRPAADDRILHAERREWSDTAGVKRWQWFLAVEPSPGLVKYLRDDNAFSLTPTAVVPEIGEAPAWFAFQAADVEVLQAPHGNMRLLFSKTKRLASHQSSSLHSHRLGADKSAARGRTALPSGELTLLGASAQTRWFTEF